MWHRLPTPVIRLAVLKPYTADGSHRQSCCQQESCFILGPPILHPQDSMCVLTPGWARGGDEMCHLGSDALKELFATHSSLPWRSPQRWEGRGTTTTVRLYCRSGGREGFLACCVRRTQQLVEVRRENENTWGCKAGAERGKTRFPCTLSMRFLRQPMLRR